MKKRITSAALALVMAVGALTLGLARPAEARDSKREKMWRYGTYAAAAATGAALLKNRDTWALVGAAATYGAYKGWKRETSKRNRRERAYRNYRSYRNYGANRSYRRYRVRR